MPRNHKELPHLRQLKLATITPCGSLVPPRPGQPILALALALMNESGEALQTPHAGEVFGHPLPDIFVSPSPTNSLFPHVIGTSNQE